VGYDLIVAAPRPISTLLAVDPYHARASLRRTARQCARRLTISKTGHSWYAIDATVETTRSCSVGECRFFYAWREPSWRTAPARPRIGGRTARGQRNVLDSRALYAHAHAADALYRTSLRHELEVRTPWSAWRSFEGVERVVGLDEGYRALWSGHHRDRGEKLAWTREETVRSWSHDLSRYEPLGVVPVARRERGVLDEHRFAGALEGETTWRVAMSSWLGLTRLPLDKIPGPHAPARRDLSRPSITRRRLRADDARARRAHVGHRA